MNKENKKIIDKLLIERYGNCKILKDRENSKGMYIKSSKDGVFYVVDEWIKFTEKALIEKEKEIKKKIDYFDIFLRNVRRDLLVVGMKLDTLSNTKVIPYPHTRSLNLLYKELKKVEIKIIKQKEELKKSILGEEIKK